MSQTTSAFPQFQSQGWRAGLRVIFGFLILYAAIWIVRVIMGVVPNMLMRWLGASPDFRAYVASTLNYGVGIFSYILCPALALQRELGIDPREIFFPLRRG